MSEKKKKERQMEILLDEQTAQGAYVNMAVVNHSESEFIVDFMFVQPQAPRASVRSRIITSPRHLKRLIATLEENLKAYEELHGAVVEPVREVNPDGDRYH